MTILALLEGWAVYGERLNLSLALGTVVVAAGIGLAGLGSIRDARSVRRAAREERAAGIEPA